MTKEFKLPDLGEGVEGGDVVQVLVAPGDEIQAEQTVAEIETDKAVLEVPCPFAGKVAEVHIKQGDEIKVGAILLTVETDGDASGEKTSPKPDEETDKPREPEQKPDKQESSPKPRKQEPDKKSAAKAEPESKEEASGKREELAGEEKKPDREDHSDGPPRDDQEPIPAGPATRRLARELGVDLRAVAEQYPGERLSEEQVKDFVRQRQAAPSASALHRPALGAAERPGVRDFSRWGTIERVAFTKLQSKTAENLAVAWSAVPHVTQFDLADTTALDTLRRRFQDTEQAKEVKLTVTAFVLKAVTIALKTFPQFNASLDEDKGELILKKYYHIGVAVDTDAGLIVPVVRNVDGKGVLKIAAEMNELAERTRQRKVSLEELRGGTFTVTNLGGIGGTAFTPIINYPEVAILGLARSREEPKIVDGQWKSRTMLPLCLSYDHRVINGADGARFIRKVAALLEDPEMLLLGG